MEPQEINIADLFFEAAVRYPHKMAIIQDHQTITFQELAQEVEASVVYFQQCGLKPGDRVLVFVPMGIDLYRVVLALFRMGATAVFLDEWVSMARLEACCRIAHCQAFIGTTKARILGLLSAELRKIPIKINSDLLGGRIKRLQPVPGSTRAALKATDTALITFTTGSTGTPKAARRTHGFLQAQFDALIEKIDPQPTDVDMPVLPIVLLINLGAGCSSVIAQFKASKPEAMQPAKIWAQMERYGVTRITASPFFLRQLSLHLSTTGHRAASVQKIFTGGAPVFPAEAALYEQAFPGVAIEIVYGSTEAEPISAISSRQLLATTGPELSRGLPVGLPYRKAHVRIIRITDEPIECADAAAFDEWALPPNELGEIIVSGPHVLDAYFNNEEALRRNKIWVDGRCWHRSGDSGYLDVQGQLYLCGRCASLIRRPDGQCLAPFVYESYFQSLKGVEIGTLLEHQGRLVAVLETSPGVQQEALANLIRNRLPELDELRFLDKIPRDPRHHAKIDYARLTTLGE